jgi:hypothetical protein
MDKARRQGSAAEQSSDFAADLLGGNVCHFSYAGGPLDELTRAIRAHVAHAERAGLAEGALERADIGEIGLFERPLALLAGWFHLEHGFLVSRDLFRTPRDNQNAAAHGRRIAPLCTRRPGPDAGRNRSDSR